MDALTIVIGVAVIALAVALVVVAVQRRKKVEETTRLDEYAFYPFITDDAGLVHFSPERFDEATAYFLSHRNPTAARELIVIGEQNRVRDTFSSEPLSSYRQLYVAYDGEAVISDNEVFLENYKRIVRLIGQSFPNTGIEILLHNLVNPAKSVIAIENGAVTGRTLEMGTTSLVLDLKTRRQRGQDKLNYQLDIGARRFKCTTIPDLPPRVRAGRRNLHQYRRTLPARGSHAQPREAPGIHGQFPQGRHADRGEHPLARRISGRHQRKASFSRRGDPGRSPVDRRKAATSPRSCSPTCPAIRK